MESANFHAFHFALENRKETSDPTEHYLDHLEPHGRTNTHDALRLVIDRSVISLTCPGDAV